MKKNLVIVLFCLTTMLVGCKNKVDSVINIAFNMPITGDLGYMGEEVQSGLTLALEDYSDTISRYGYKIVVDFQDNKGQVKDAVTIFNMQKSHKPDLYMSGVLPQVMAIKEMVKKEGVPHHIWAFSPLYLNREDDMFRTWLNLGIEADQYVKVITSRNAKKVAYIYVNIQGCQEQCEEVVIPKVKELSPDCEITPLPYPSESTDLKNIVLKAKQLNPDLIIINGFKNQMISLIRSLKSNKMIGDRNVVGSFDLLDAAPELSADELENITMSVPVFMTLNSTDEYLAWKEKFYAKYNRYPEHTDAYAYDYGRMLVEAIRIMKENDITLREALFKVSIEGITGPLHFMENGELNVPIVQCSFKNHKLIPDN